MERVFLAIKNFTTIKTFASFLNDNYEVETYSDEVTAINALQNNQYDFILIDLSPSKMNGEAVLQYLADSKQITNQPVSIILDTNNLQKELDIFNLGCAEIFCPPFDSLLTKKRIQNVITIHSLKKHVAVYEQKLITDPMTGLLNKDGFQTKVRKFLKNKTPGAFIMCDLDGLKYINDNFSHLVGDEIIRGVGKCIEEVMPKDSYLAHVSGDEFSLFLKGLDNQEEISNYCTKFLKTLQAKVLLPDLSRPVTSSMGIAIYPEIATTYEKLSSKADHALLYVKNHGKNGFKFHAPRDDREEALKGRQECTNVSMDLMIKERIGEEIQTWLKFGEFRVVYITYKKYSSDMLAAQLCLLNIIDTKDHENPDCKKILSLNEKISTFIKDAQYPGIFAWYSINQLLIFSIKKETLPQGIQHLKAELEDEMKALQLDIELIMDINEKKL